MCSNPEGFAITVGSRTIYNIGSVSVTGGLIYSRRHGRLEEGSRAGVASDDSAVPGPVEGSHGLQQQSQPRSSLAPWRWGPQSWAVLPRPFSPRPRPRPRPPVKCMHAASRTERSALQSRVYVIGWVTHTRSNRGGRGEGEGGGREEERGHRWRRRSRAGCVDLVETRCDGRARSADRLRALGS